MSGPKVVRIVTREEIIAICKDQLAQLEAALRRWEKVGRRNALLSDKDIESTRERQAQLCALLTKDRFVDLQKQVPDEITFLANDMERRLCEAASKAATARVYALRLATMAQQALDRSTSGQQVLPEALRRDLENVIQSGGTDRKHAEKILADVLASHIGSGGAPVLTSEQRALAERLGAGNKAKPLEEWLKDNMPEAEAGALKSQEAIEELALIARQEAAPFAARHRSIAAEPPGKRRQMLADTLMLDVSNALASAKARAEQLRILELRSASLSVINTAEAKELLRKVTAVLAEGDSGAVGALAAQVSEFLERQRKVAAAKAQHSAIVTALKGLGYEVREGLATAAPQDGKVILRRAANPEMGVEVAGMHGGGRVQFRPVRFGPATSSGDSRRDRDIETIWCSDFDHLKGRFDGPNGLLKVEQARTVGEVPVLFVDVGPDADSRRPEVRKPAKTRSLE
jgi:hypothetical protein